MLQTQNPIRALQTSIGSRLNLQYFNQAFSTLYRSRTFCEHRLWAELDCEISRDVETAERKRTDLHPTDGKQTKAEQLAEAGIPTSTAQHYQQWLAARENYPPRRK